jgi:hypothetical protein
MLKFWCVLIGKDYDNVLTYRKSSQEKIILFGSMLLIPVTLWALNGYMMSREIFGMGIIGSLGTAIILGFIIYLIERSIILAQSNPTINRLRVILGLIVAILGSLTMDEVIFKNDIDNMMQTYKVEGVDNETAKWDSLYVERIDSVARIVNFKSGVYKQRSDEYALELEGKANSGQGGDGPLAKRKEILMNRSYDDLVRDQEVLKGLEVEYRTNREFSKKDARESFNDKGLLMRMRAMFRLIFSDWVSFIVFLLYFLLVLIMETLVIFMKKFTPKSPDEELEEMGDKLLVSKHKKMLDYRKSAYDLDLR